MASSNGYTLAEGKEPPPQPNEEELDPFEVTPDSVRAAIELDPYVVLFANEEGEDTMSVAMSEQEAREAARKWAEEGMNVLSVIDLEGANEWLAITKILGRGGPTDKFRLRYSDEDGESYTGPLTCSDAWATYQELRGEGYVVTVHPEHGLTANPETVEGTWDNALESAEAADTTTALRRALARAEKLLLAAEARHNDRAVAARPRGAHRSMALDWALRLHEIRAQQKPEPPTAQQLIDDALLFEDYLDGEDRSQQD